MASKYSTYDDELQHNQRVSDFGTEPCTMLMPIKGYEKKPLVSLEEAVEPIVSIVPDVQQMAYVAKMKCRKPPADNLSLDESASIMLYSMEWEPQEECLYHVLNTTLRSENRRSLAPWFLFLKLILTAFARLPSTHRFVYRGIKRDMRKDYPKGETIIWWGFSSCTSTVDVLENEQFLGSKGTRTLFTIECTNGKDIRNHSYFQSEDEILLPPGRQFQVVACLNQPGGFYMIQLKEVEPPYPLLEPVSKDIKQLSKPISSFPSTNNTNVEDIETNQKSKADEQPVQLQSYTTDKTTITTNKSVKPEDIKTDGKAGSIVDKPAQTLHGIETVVTEKPPKTEQMITAPKANTLQKGVNKVDTASNSGTGLLGVISSWFSTPKDMNKGDEQFAEPGSYKPLDCKGRPCANCGQCRDWYYTGDLASWRWIQNWRSWKDKDWKRWNDGKTWERFKRRSGVNCVGRLYDDHGGGRRGCYDGRGIHCLCDDNRRS